MCLERKKAEFRSARGSDLPEATYLLPSTELKFQPKSMLLWGKGREQRSEEGEVEDSWDGGWTRLPPCTKKPRDQRMRCGLIHVP